MIYDYFEDTSLNAYFERFKVGHRWIGLNKDDMH